MNRSEKLSCIIKCAKALLNIWLCLECGGIWMGGCRMLCVHMDEWVSGQPDVSQRWLYQRTAAYMSTCECKADSTSPVSWSLCLKRQFTGLDLTSLFSHSLACLKEVKMFVMPTECVSLLSSIVASQCPVRNADSFWGNSVFLRPCDRSSDKLSSCEQNVDSNPSICAQIMWHLIFFDVKICSPRWRFKRNTLQIKCLLFLLSLPRSKWAAGRHREAERSVWGKSYTAQKTQNFLTISVGGASGCHTNYPWSGSRSFTRPFFF